MPKKESTASDHHDRIARIVRHLEDHLDEPIDLDELARRAAYAKHHFHRVFRGVTGESVVAHVRRLRLERAARRLRHASASVTGVALECGYDAPEAFTRAFAQHFGVAPSAYRGEPSPRVRGLASDLAPHDVAVAIRFEPAVPVLALRHVGAYRDVGATFGALLEAARAAGLPLDPPRLYGLCPDDPDVTPEAHLRFDACIAPRREGREGPEAASALTPREIPEGTYAVAVHRGPYATLSETYLRLIGHWLPGTPYVLADEAVVEAYLDDPETTCAEECRTEVRVRLAR